MREVLKSMREVLKSMREVLKSMREVLKSMRELTGKLIAQSQSVSKCPDKQLEETGKLGRPQKLILAFDLGHNYTVRFIVPILL